MANADVLLGTGHRLTFDDYEKVKSGLTEMIRNGKKFVEDSDQGWILNIDHIVMITRMEEEER